MQNPPPASSSHLASSLRSDFWWGYATAAAQIEGGWNADGKGESAWDRFSHTPGRIVDKSTNEDACRSYDFYKQDVQILKKLGVNAYRFSLAWSRIVPLGGKDDPVNGKGLQFYSDLVDELLANGITPFVTLFHWYITIADLILIPQALEDKYNGMLSPAQYTPDFIRYARLCFEKLGDRVKHWITYNEPGVYTLAGYADGGHVPGRSSMPHRPGYPGDSSTEPFIVAHTQLVSHGHVVKMYREEFQAKQKGTIGITLHGNYSYPWDETDLRDVDAAERARLFEIAWFADPVYGKGPVDYPSVMRDQLGDRLPTFTEEEKKLVRGSSDFYGMNSYTSFFVKHRDAPPEIWDHQGNIEKLITNKTGVGRGPESESTDWLATTPWGFRNLLIWIWERYQMPIYITENGTTSFGEADWKPKIRDDVIDDKHRREFLQGYLGAVATVVRENGVDVRSYFGWTLMDNWEWAKGYSDRFGVVWTDYNSAEKTRYPKKSAYEMRKIFKHLIAPEKE